MKTLLFLLVSFIAVTSTVSGLMMISSPDGGILSLPLSLLQGTPFRNYLLPGILLVGLVGSVNIVAVYTNISRNISRYNWSIAGGVMITGWIIVQMIVVQSMHWLHFVYLGTGVLIILTGYQLKGRWAV